MRSRVEENVAAYPGSYECEALTEFALLPVAEELGLGLRSRSCALMRRGSSLSAAWQDSEYDRGEHSYWLLERGWEEPRPEEKSK